MSCCPVTRLTEVRSVQEFVVMFRKTIPEPGPFTVQIGHASTSPSLVMLCWVATADDVTRSGKNGFPRKFAPLAAPTLTWTWRAAL